MSEIKCDKVVVVQFDSLNLKTCILTFSTDVPVTQIHVLIERH